MGKTLVILDNGHGRETPGKRSPIWADGRQLFEFEFNRTIVNLISRELDLLRIPNVRLVPEVEDVPLSERVRRANALYRDWGYKAYLISVHANAGGGTGWECFTSVGQTKSDGLATILYEEAEREFFPDWRIRSDWSDGDPDKESNFYILAKTQCPAVLTENFFMDTERDCRFIMSEEGRARVVKIHVEAIKRFKI